MLLQDKSLVKFMKSGQGTDTCVCMIPFLCFSRIKICIAYNNLAGETDYVK